MTKKNVQEICRRFADHNLDCKTCSFVVDLDNENTLCEIYFTTDAKPALCQAGKEILFDIFN